uniref:Protein hunchback n=1 Tax=Lonchoptera lutea TaxID=92596 RepID=B4YK63_9MUSC|nr:putative hunchback [Lonchoptera lutea]
MQNWDTLQPTASYEHNWYGNMFPTIKTESMTHSPTTSQLEQYLTMKQQEMNSLTPSPRADINGTSDIQNFFDSHNLQNGSLHHNHPLGFNPLTPPGLPNAVLPAVSHFHHNITGIHANNPASPLAQQSEGNTQSLTPRNTPPMDITPPKSPKLYSEYVEKDHDMISNSSDDTKFLESDDDSSIRTPIYNSHGKMKNYKCKSCGYMAVTKVAFWEHASSHMKPEKILQCPKCPFVTELKHHLEYHIRKHKNLKPFQCDKCNYSCVNKSMLNSHRKSHSSVYQYRCADCDYATKYCHSFKLHLRKYDHKPGMVLDEDGCPNPSIIIDVYGTRRGPKMKSQSGGGGGKISSGTKKLSAIKAELKVPCGGSQLSAALQGQLHFPASPAKSSNSSSSEYPAVSSSSLSLSQQVYNQQQNQQQQQQYQQQQQQQQQHQQQQQQKQQQSLPQISNLLPPLASILQQGRNMSFFPYWNINLQMLAAQQQVLAQMSPSMRETTIQNLQNGQSQVIENDKDSVQDFECETDDEFNRRSNGSAIDLSQSNGTPTKITNFNQNTFQMSTNVSNVLADSGMQQIKSKEEINTPTISSSCSSRRKGRVLKLDINAINRNLVKSPEIHSHQPRSTESPSSSFFEEPKLQEKSPPHNSMDTNSISMLNSPESLDLSSTAVSAPVPSAFTTTTISNTNNNSTTPNTTSTTNTTSSSNISNVSSSNRISNNPTSSQGNIYECKYCDIFFKDAVLYTIHMGYHSCDDVFKCNMCGEKCDGPVGLFVHMARNPHS